MNRIIILFLLVTISCSAFAQDGDYTELGYFSFSKQRTDVEDMLMSFDATKQSGSVALSWQTSAVSDRDRFVIERSSNGVDFSLLTSMPASTLSNSAAYQTVDFNPLEGENFYRLTQHTANGKTYIYPLRMIKMDKEKFVHLYPNPLITNSIHVDAGVTNVVTRIAIADVQGRKIAEYKAARIIAGPQTFNISGKLSPGLYLVSIFMNETVVVKKIIVQ